MKWSRWCAYGICVVVAFSIGWKGWSRGAPDVRHIIGLHVVVASERESSPRRSRSRPSRVLLLYSDACPYSRAQLTHWLKLSSDFPSGEFLLISLGPIEESLASRLDRAGIRYGGTAPKHQALSAILTLGTPVTLLLDGSERVRSVRAGLRPLEELRAFVSSGRHTSAAHDDG